MQSIILWQQRESIEKVKVSEYSAVVHAIATRGLHCKNVNYSTESFLNKVNSLLSNYTS